MPEQTIEVTCPACSDEFDLTIDTDQKINETTCICGALLQVTNYDPTTEEFEVVEVEEEEETDETTEDDQDEEQKAGTIIDIETEE